MKIEIFDEFNNRLKNIWKNCKTDTNSTIFQNYDWIENWYNNFGDYYKTNLCISVAYKDEDVICILPLCINSKNSFKVLEWIGLGVSDYMLPIIKDNVVIDKKEFEIIFKKIFYQCNQIDLMHLINQPEIINNSINPLVKYFKNNIISTSYRILIDTEWSSYTKSNKSIKRKSGDLDRDKRKLTNYNSNISFSEYVDISSMTEVTKKLIEMKETQYKSTGVKNIFKYSMFRNFYLNLLKRDTFINKVHITSLAIDDKIIALHYGLKEGKTYYYLIPAYEQEFNKFSPGNILLKKLMEDKFDNGFKFFDFLPGNEKYKGTWSNNKFNNFEYLKPISVKGYIFYIFLSTRNLLKKSNLLKKILYVLRKNI